MSNHTAATMTTHKRIRGSSPISEWFADKSGAAVLLPGEGAVPMKQVLAMVITVLSPHQTTKVTDTIFRPVSKIANNSRAMKVEATVATTLREEAISMRVTVTTNSSQVLPCEDTLLVTTTTRRILLITLATMKEVAEEAATEIIGLTNIKVSICSLVVVV